MEFKELLTGPHQRFNRAARCFAVALSDALGELDVRLPAGPLDGDGAGAVPLKATRRQARQRLRRFISEGSVHAEARTAWKRGQTRSGHMDCQVEARWPLLLLMRNRRIVRTPQELFDLLDRHCPVCPSGCHRCLSLGKGYREVREGFSLWFRRSKTVRDVLKRVESTWLPIGELTIYLYTQRRFDCAVDLALATGTLDEEAYRLPLWARDATRWYREKECRRHRAPAASLDDQGGVARTLAAPSEGPALGLELQEQLQLAGDVVDDVLQQRHPADQLVVYTMWNLILEALRDPAGPDQDGIIAAGLRSMAATSPLVDALEEVRDRLSLGEQGRRWKRPVVRLVILGCIDRTSYVKEKKRYLARNNSLYRKIVESVEDAWPPEQISLRNLTAAFLDKDSQEIWARRETADDVFRLAVHLLRDIYDESMAVIHESVAEELQGADDFFLMSNCRGSSRASARINPWAIVLAHHFSHLHMTGTPVDDEASHGDRYSGPAENGEGDTWEYGLSDEERDLVNYLKDHIDTSDNQGRLAP